MNVEPEPHAELSPEEEQLAERLSAHRPVPAGGFRGELGRLLAVRDPGYGPRPERLRLIVGCYLGAAIALVALGWLTGVGVL
jgi:hypothetical protein